MLEITIPSREFWDEKNETFVYTKETKLKLEHSLVSLSKWESKWNKAFLSKQSKTMEETIDYIKCMTLTQNVNPEVYKYLTNDNIRQVNEYIEAPMTATVIRELGNSKPNRDILTAEIIYYWMISFNIPFECQKWHLNRLLTLIRVCNIKNAPKKSMSKGEIMRQNAELNAMRRQQLNSKG